METTYKIYKCLTNGSYTFILPIEEKEKEVQHLINFNNHVHVEKNPKLIIELDKILEEEKDLPIKKKRILTEEEYTEHVTPERAFFEFDGKLMHIKNIRKVLDWAKEKGYDFEKLTPPIVMHESKSTFSQGTKTGVKQKDN